MVSNQCVKEARELRLLAQSLAAAGDRGGAERAEARRSELLQVGLSSDELRAKYASGLDEELNPRRKGEHRRLFENYLADGQFSRADRELRDYLVGTQSISYTQAAAGGYSVPVEYDPIVYETMAQTDPILDDEVTSFTMADSAFIRPRTVSGFDLSTIAAQVVGETTQQSQVTPPVAGARLRSDIKFKFSITASFEAEQDIPSFVEEKVVRPSMVALARKIGQSALAGRGGTDISGIVKALGTPSVNNGTSGKVVSSDITNLYFAVNAWYRESVPRTGWLMSDQAYKYVRNSTDNSLRPLLDFQDEKKTIMGKPLYICPSLATAYNSLGVGVVLFGDLSSIIIRAGRPVVIRTIEHQGGVEKGESLYHAYCAADATYFDPSGGLNPPLAMALWS